MKVERDKLLMQQQISQEQKEKLLQQLKKSDQRINHLKRRINKTTTKEEKKNVHRKIVNGGILDVILGEKINFEEKYGRDISKEQYKEIALFIHKHISENFIDNDNSEVL